MEEKNIKITINVECSEKSSVKKEQIAGYLLRAIAGVAANNKCIELYTMHFLRNSTHKHQHLKQIHFLHNFYIMKVHIKSV